MKKIVELSPSEIATVKGAGLLSNFWASITGQAGKIRIH